MPDREDRDPARWWRNAVIYEVYIRSFADGNGDGVGDIGGLRSRLRYLADLGIDALWITPWYRSPMKDGGYDVSDFRDIDPQFGTLADATALIAEAHGVGLRVLLDIVPNHVSDEHIWFQWARRRRRRASERLDKRVRWAGVDTGDRARWLARAVVPAPVHSRATRS